MATRKTAAVATATAEPANAPQPAKPNPLAEAREKALRDSIRAVLGEQPTIDTKAVVDQVLDAMMRGTTIVPMIEWEFRYRTAKTLETVRLRTYTDQEQEARAVADKYLQKLASPNLRFVYLRLSCVATSADYPEATARFRGQAAQLPKPLPIPDPEQPRVTAPAATVTRQAEDAATVRASAGVAPPTTEELLAGRGRAPVPPGFEDVDDGMAGPPVAADEVRRRRVGT